MRTTESATHDGFFKSSYSNDGPACVEVRHDSDTVFVRDSKFDGPRAEQPTIAVPAARWPAVLDLARGTASGEAGDLVMAWHSDNALTLTGPSTTGATIELRYTPDEGDAFAKGVVAGEFDRP